MPFENPSVYYFTHGSAFYCAPKFPGWRMVELTEQLKSGDNWVWIGDAKKAKEECIPPTMCVPMNNFSQMILGNGMVQIKHGQFPNWLAYRMVTKKTAIEMNPIHAEPVPLP